MKRFFTFILLLGSLLSFAQSPTLSDFVGKFTFQGFSSGGTSDVTGTLDGFSDQTNQYFASAIQVGDVVWDNLGNRWEVMAVNSSNLLQASVDLRDVNSAGGVPSGVGFVSRETDQIGLSLFVPDNNIGISQQLKSRVESHNMLLLEQYITAHQDSVYQGATAADTSGIADPTTGDVLVTGDGNILFFDGGQWVTFTGGGGGSPDGNGIYSSSDTIPNGIKSTVRDSFEFNGILGGYDEPGATFSAGKITRYDTDYWGEGLRPWGIFQSYDYGGGTQIAFSGTYPYGAWMQDVSRGSTAGSHFYQDWNQYKMEVKSGSTTQSLRLSSTFAELRGGQNATPSYFIISPLSGDITQSVQSAYINLAASSGNIAQSASGAFSITGGGLVGISKTGTTGFLSITAPDDQIIIQGEETQVKGDTAIIIQAGAGEDIVIKNNDITFPNTVDGTLDKVLGLNAAGKLITGDPGGGGSDTNIYNTDGTIPAATDRKAYIDNTSTFFMGDTTSTGIGLKINPPTGILSIGELEDTGPIPKTEITVNRLSDQIRLQSNNNLFVQVDGQEDELLVNSAYTRFASHNSGNVELLFDNPTSDYAIRTNTLTMRIMGQSTVNPIVDISHAAPTSFTINPNGEITFNAYDQSKHDEVLSYGHQVLDQNGVAKKVYDGEFNFRDDANVNALNIHTVIINNSSITLPAASSNTGKIFIIIANSSTTPATPRTIDVSGGGTIQLNPSISMDKPFEVYALVSTGSQYLVLWNKEMAYDLTVRPNNAPYAFASFSSGTNNQNPYDGYTARVNSTTNGNTTTLNLSSLNLNPGDAVYVMGAATVSGATVNIGASGGVNIRFKGQLVTNIQLTGPQYIELKLIWTGTEFWAFTSQ